MISLDVVAHLQPGRARLSRWPILEEVPGASTGRISKDARPWFDAETQEGRRITQARARVG